VQSTDFAAEGGSRCTSTSWSTERSCWTASAAPTTERFDNGTFALATPGMVHRTQIPAPMRETLGRASKPGEVAVVEWRSSAPSPPGRVRDGLTAAFTNYDHRGNAASVTGEVLPVDGRLTASERQPSPD
jgi:hypothetical protein